MNIRASVTLPPCVKGKTYRLNIPLLLNGVPYPNFAAFALGTGGASYAGKVRKTNFLGSVVASTWTPQTPHANAVMQLLVTAGDTVSLDCEYLLAELEFNDGTDILPVLLARIPVQQEVTY